MTLIKDYYGDETERKTYLSFYSEGENGKDRVVHRRLEDGDAYDAWHLSFYFREILAYKHLLGREDLAFQDIPRKEKNLLLYLLLLTSHKKTNIKLMELGSSLFELIEGLELVEKFFLDKKSSIKLKEIEFIGIDISQELCFASKILHPGYNVTTFADVEQANFEIDFLYDRNVSSYAFTEAGEVASLLNLAEASLLNLFLSQGETFSSARLGKKLTYFSRSDLVKQLNKPLFHLFGEKAPGPLSGESLDKGRPVLEGFFLCCEIAKAEEFMRIAHSIPEISTYFTEKNIKMHLLEG